MIRSERVPLGTRLAATAVGVAGLVLAGLSVLYIAGAFGLSTATASKLVRAYEVGGWALTLALMAFSAGTAGAILLVLRKYIEKKSRKWLVA